MPFNDGSLLGLKKISTYLFFCWLLMLNVSPLAKLVNDVYFYVSSFVVMFPLFFIFRKIYKEKGIGSYDKYLVIFLLISVVSCVVNFYGIPSNIKRVVWTSIYTLFVFSDDDLREILENIKLIFCTFMFISSLVSIGMFFAQYHKELVVGSLPLRIGFVENRLFGMYVDPNYASTSSILCFYLCIQKIHEGKNEIFSLINIMIQLIYMSLSNSRTCQVSLSLSFMFFCFMFFFKKLSFERNIGKDKILNLSLIYSILCSILLLSLLKCISYVSIEASNSLNFYLDPRYSSVSLTRIDIEHSHEYSSGRFAIWLNALEIFKKNWILGVSPGYVTGYAEQYFPHGIIATKKYVGLHNSIVDVLVSVGILGGISFAFFLLKFVFFVIRSCFRKPIILYDFEFNTLISSLLSILISSLFLSEILFFGKVGTFLFWLFLSEIRRKIKKEYL